MMANLKNVHTCKSKKIEVSQLYLFPPNSHRIIKNIMKGINKYFLSRLIVLLLNHLPHYRSVLRGLFFF